MARIDQILETKDQEVIDIFLPMFEAMHQMTEGHPKTRYSMLVDMEKYLLSGDIERLIQAKKDGTLEAPESTFGPAWIFED